MTNAHIAAAFEELADLYELDGAVQYRVIAYRTAARAVRDASVSVMQLAREGRATELPGVGKTLEEKLKALDETGDIPAAQRLRGQFPPGLISIMHLPGFGPKRARRLFDELGIDSLDALRAACERHELRGLRGFGPKVEEKLLEALAEGADGQPAPRVLLSRALPIAEQIAGALRGHPGAERVEVAGSLRRQADAVKDLDVIATAADPAGLVQTLTELPLVESVQSSGDVGARVLTHSGMKVDLKVVEPDQFGNVLQHFTGSKAHNVALREAAVRRGLHVSEYGILDDATGETTRCATEEEVYERLGLPWIPPELREGRGELEAAAAGRLPELVTLEDIRGDLHSHTTLSDGRQDLDAMVEAARKRGYEYLAITDHSATHGFGNHVDADALRAQVERVRALDAQLDDFTVLIGTETNVLPDGSRRLPRRRAGRAGLGDRLRAHLVRDARAGDDRPHRGRDRAPARRRHRPPHRPQDRDARPLRGRHGRRDRGRRAHGHDARDQRRARPARPQRRPRPGRRGGRRDDPGELRRALDPQPRADALRHRHRPARLAHPGAGGEHPALGGARRAAQAGAEVTAAPRAAAGRRRGRART